MVRFALTERWTRFLRQQQLYIAIAVAIYAIFWAIEPQRANAIVTLVYTLCLCNLTVWMRTSLSFLYAERSSVHYWLIYSAMLCALAPVMVFIATCIVFYVDNASPPDFWPYLKTSWKFPLVATLIFGIAAQIYHRTKYRLERRNRELQRTVQIEIAQRELQEQELQRAREIQQSLLPTQIPQVPGFEISGMWEPARVVGGDYFDVLKLSDSKLGICIADVVGKSVSAALLMANVQATVRAFASESSSPAWLCSRVNAVLCNNIASGKFVTLFYGVLDANRSVLEYANAGHLPPILISHSGQVTRLENGGALLGVFPQWKYQDSSVKLSGGDRLLLYTDGITEASSPSGEEFGEDRLIAAANARFRNSASALQQALLSEAKLFCDSHLQDDATLIVIAVQPAQSTAHSNPSEAATSLRTQVSPSSK